jgi:hypothetical protein
MSYGTLHCLRDFADGDKTVLASRDLEVSGIRRTRFGFDFDFRNANCHFECASKSLKRS